LYKVLEKTFLQEIIVRMVIEAPEIARKRKAGQFVTLMIDDKGERIPLTIVDSDSEKGTITIIFQIVGKTTTHLASLKKGDYIMHILGPLGHATEIENFGTAAIVP
jgi:NAD(P)H-flavin reductase